MMNHHLWKVIFLLLLIIQIEISSAKRGGGGGFGRGGGSRGSSAARASSSKSSGGWFGGGGSKPAGGMGTQTHGGGYSQPNYGRTGTGSSGGGFGKTSGFGGYRTSAYSNTGMGSRSRSDMFKNMIVGAAAGYLTYQAGKAIIRSMSHPMNWNGRQYYWGQQYYPGAVGGYGGTTMCRMPLESNDPKFGNIYTPDGSRPKEIVWSCGINERCCGYECCPGGYNDGGYGGRHWNSGPGIGIGTILLLLLICACGVFIVKKIYDKKRENELLNESGKEYRPGNVNYTAAVPTTEAPPPYGGANNGYPPENGWRYPPA